MSVLEKFKMSLPPLPTSPPNHTPDRETLLQMGALIGLVLAFHFSISSLEIGVYSCVIFLIKFLCILGNRKNPPQWLVMILTVVSIILIIMSYGGWNGQTAGISFLVLLVSLKYLESNSVRDYFVVCLIMYFLGASSFLFSASLPNIIIVLIFTVAVTGILFKITTPARLSDKAVLFEATKLVAKSVPLALILFFFFPRVSGSFGFLPSLDSSASALDDALVAGDFASSAFSNEPAFKVEFDGEIPSNAELYWRSKTMTKEINFSWEVSEENLLNPENKQSAKVLEDSTSEDGAQYSYRIIHEETSDLFLPFLDYVSDHSIGSINYDYSVSLKRPQRGSISYQGFSKSEPLLQIPGSDFRESLIQTSGSPSAKVQALLSSAAAKSTNQRELADNIFFLFADGYEYTLTPESLDEFNTLDDFLFNTKSGYCEHYASAFTTLLRFARIPSRVVVGFQGGKQNSAGDFIEVKYSDAHAWSEAYIDGKWVRYDPTSLTSPERIEFGMDAIRELWDNDLFGNPSSGAALSDFLNPTGTAKMWRTLSDTWSNVQFQWKKWIVDYDADTQKELLESLGLSFKNTLLSLTLILGISVSLILLLYFRQLLPKKEELDELEKLYSAFAFKIKKMGVERKPADTPNEFSDRISALFPEQREDLERITQKFNALRYGKKAENHQYELESLKQDIKLLRLTTE